jgi:phosphohistidine phosphatase
MLLVLVRHAIAAPLGVGMASDRERPLTPKGEERFRHVAKSLAQLLPRPRAILTSPLLRARQTADLVAQAWGGPRPRVLPALADGDGSGVRRALADYDNADTVALVGHEPWISEITAHLLGGKPARAFRYRKGGVAAIEVKGMGFACGTLLWFVPPRVFRRI